MATPNGTILHMEPVELTDLPPHPDFADQGFAADADAARPSLKDFVTAVILEADAAMDASSLQWEGPEKARPSLPSDAGVRRGKKTVTAEEMAGLGWKESLLPSRRKRPVAGAQDWFGRRSVHESAETAGTATFAEMDDGLRRDHAPQETGYDATIYDLPLVVDYTAQVADTEFGSGLSAVEVKVYEMCHTMPMPLKPRVFDVCIVGARLGENKFVVVQLPVDLAKYPGAMYASGRNVQDGGEPQKQKPVVVGYVSVERGTDLGGKTDLEMIVASNAGGALPLAVQKMAIPGAIAKDVGHFMEFNHKKRAASKGPSSA